AAVLHGFHYISFGPARGRAKVRRVDRPWVLVLTRARGAPLRRVGGLPVALRLALDAQRAGATAVVCAPTEDVPRHVLDDRRLKLPVLEAPPPGARKVHASAS